MRAAPFLHLKKPTREFGFFSFRYLSKTLSAGGRGRPGGVWRCPRARGARQVPPQPPTSSNKQSSELGARPGTAPHAAARGQQREALHFFFLSSLFFFFVLSPLQLELSNPIVLNAYVPVFPFTNSGSPPPQELAALPARGGNREPREHGGSRSGSGGPLPPHSQGAAAQSPPPRPGFGALRPPASSPSVFRGY